MPYLSELQRQGSGSSFLVRNGEQQGWGRGHGAQRSGERLTARSPIWTSSTLCHIRVTLVRDPIPGACLWCTAAIPPLPRCLIDGAQEVVLNALQALQHCAEGQP